jgi:hypothetical protein
MAKDVNGPCWWQSEPCRIAGMAHRLIIYDSYGRLVGEVPLPDELMSKLTQFPAFDRCDVYPVGLNRFDLFIEPYELGPLAHRLIIYDSYGELVGEVPMPAELMRKLAQFPAFDRCDVYPVGLNRFGIYIEPYEWKPAAYPVTPPPL